MTREQHCIHCNSSVKELRPYGHNGAWVCFVCAMETSERNKLAEFNFGAQLDAPVSVAVIGEEAGPRPLMRMATDYVQWVDDFTEREQELEALLREARTVIDSELSGHGHDHWDKQGNHGRTCPRCIVQRDAGGFDMLRKIDAALAEPAQNAGQVATRSPYDANGLKEYPGD